jgi:fructose-1-phosphate kinase PfkB-like protein
VGSGDAFLAGFLTGLGRGLPPDEALRLAGGAGAANARRPGQAELDTAEAERIAASLAVRSLDR